jgi:hypothetical protein
LNPGGVMSEQVPFGDRFTIVLRPPSFGRNSTQ